MTEPTENYEPKHYDPMTPLTEEDAITPIDEQKPPALVFSSATYEWLRALVEVLLPGAGTFYLALATIWDLPGGEKVSATLGAAAVALGLLVRLARRSYNKSEVKYDGQMNLQDNEDGGQTMDLELNAHPATLVDKKEITFRVVNK